MSREDCKSCRFYAALNSHQIDNGVPYKTCAKGEVPETCKEKDKK